MRYLMPAALLMATPLGGQAPTRSVEDLRSFYAQACVRCHGVDGSARGEGGKRLGGRDFTDAAAMAGDSDEALAKTIRKGIFFGVVMPAYKAQLSEAEAALLVREILRKAERGKAIVPEAPAAR